ncbi:hypothetical protein LDJ79_24305 [Vibrio tritonius]|uniref:Uncharacterized protein n=1 Tax=Vibrio tritonius TaxID=1435069 RepID=A0ABS7YU80_9VIBR|nr:hypothetical protein [Vibrio tritonius]MCA2019238.1 hypothetical protein [Vibrio tritonius]
MKQDANKTSNSSSVSLQAKALFSKKKAFANKLNKNRNALKQLQSDKSPVTDWL